MIRAKGFFLVCAGIFLLAASYHLGASNARSEIAATGWFPLGQSGGVPYAVTASGDQWRYVPGYGWLNDSGNVFGSATGGRTIVSVIPGEAVTSSGEVWYGGIGSQPWMNAGVPPLGPTAAQRATFGQVKARYR